MICRFLIFYSWRIKVICHSASLQLLFDSLITTQNILRKNFSNPSLSEITSKLLILQPTWTHFYSSQSITKCWHYWVTDAEKILKIKAKYSLLQTPSISIPSGSQLCGLASETTIKDFYIVYSHTYRVQIPVVLDYRPNVTKH